MAVRPESRIGAFLDGRYQIVEILGVGAYGVVYGAVDVYDNTPYAIKALSKVGPTGLPIDDAQQRFQAREISLHSKARRHPNIVRLLEVLDCDDCMYVILEYCPEGDLFTAITEQHHYVGDDVIAKKLFLQLLEAVEYCHKIGIYHRDLKPENVLVCDNGQRVKLADFGLATTEKYTSDFGCGSTFYMSPECHKRFGAAGYESAPNDVWSLGVILVNLTCGRNPWKRADPRDETYSAYLCDPHFLKSILPLSNELDAILHRIFEPNPRKRITLPELREAIIRCPRFTVMPSETPSPVIDDQEWQNVVVEEQYVCDPFTPISEDFSTYVAIEAPPSPISTPQRPPPINTQVVGTIPNSHYPPTPVSPTCRPARRPKRVGRQQVRRKETPRRYARGISLTPTSSASSNRSLSQSPCPPTPTSIREAPTPHFGLYCNPVMDGLDQPFLPKSRGVQVY